MFYKIITSIITGLLVAQLACVGYLAYNSHYFYQRQLDTDAIILKKNITEGSACDAALLESPEAFGECIDYVILTRGS